MKTTILDTAEINVMTWSDRKRCEVPTGETAHRTLVEFAEVQKGNYKFCLYHGTPEQASAFFDAREDYVSSVGYRTENSARSNFRRFTKNRVK